MWIGENVAMVAAMAARPHWLTKAGFRSVSQLRLRHVVIVSAIFVFSLCCCNAQNFELAPYISEIHSFGTESQESPNISRRGFPHKTPNNAQATNASSRKDYALLFATNHYDDWPELANPVNDARAIGQELHESYGFETEVVEDARQKDVLDKLHEYLKKNYGAQDQLLIFFAGHGDYDDVENEGYVVAKDSKRPDVERISYIPQSHLRTMIDNMPAQHVFLIMDVCFGGTIDPKLNQAGSRGEIYAQISKDEFIRRKLKYTSRHYLTSGGKEYVPDGRPGQHSPFARALLEGLRSYGGQNSILTLGRLSEYMERVEPEPHENEFGKSEPGSDFLFVAK
jgi:uncharacterized caspase-like protein